MRNQSTILATLAILVALSIAVPAARAQERCTLQNLAGTYAFYERGSSLIIADPAVQPFPFHWAAALAPFVTMGEVTIAPDGSATGFYWIHAQSLSSGTDPVAVEGTLSDVSPDCTALFTYTVNVPDTPLQGDVITERLVYFNGGSEFRSIPTSIADGIPTLTWVNYGHRLFKSPGQVNMCTAAMLHGRYVIWSDSLLPPPGSAAPVFSDAAIYRLDIATDGTFSGTLYEKRGPTGGIELPVSGSVSVDPDCSFSEELEVEGSSGAVEFRGVLFDAGQQLYEMAFGETIYASIGQGARVY